MAKARKAKQLSFSMTNKIGLLSKISTSIADAGVNIQAVCAYAMGKKAYFMFLTDKNAKAKKVLNELRLRVGEEDVIAVEMLNKVGELQKVAKKISDSGVDINYMYGTAGSGKTSICVFKTANDKKAIQVINKK